MENLVASHRILLEAISFSARAHKNQLRKDGVTPYASHPFRVCLVVRQLFGIDEPEILTAAVLHDTIEDTTTDFDDVEKHFGHRVARWVALLSKDKREPEEDREEIYKARLAIADWQVKVCKLGDILDNLLDSKNTSPDQRRKTCQRSRAYLAVLDDPTYPEIARRAFDLVSLLLGEMEAGAA
jgi:guanosine-3',5'-bis(diphosphate) 3'-pyrophosphohydrolase